jgi:hypothetical protein
MLIVNLRKLQVESHDGTHSFPVTSNRKIAADKKRIYILISQIIVSEFSFYLSGYITKT